MMARARTSIVLQEIPPLLASSSSDERLLCVLAIRLALEHDNLDPCPEIVELVRPVVADADTDCRWQAAIVVGLHLEEFPETVWSVIKDFGVSTDEDIRAAVACALLEHLLEEDESGKWRNEAQQLAKKSAPFSRTLEMASRWLEGYASVGDGIEDE